MESTPKCLGLIKKLSVTILKYIRMSGFGIPAVCLLELHDKRQTFLVRGALVHPNAVKAMSLNDSGHVLDRSSDIAAFSRSYRRRKENEQSYWYRYHRAR